MSVITDMKVGDLVESGELLGGVCAEKVVIQKIEDIDGVSRFEATFFGVRIGSVTHSNGVWGELA